MKARTRTVRNLYFRWGRALGLEPEDCARVLERAGLIELTEDRQHYTETSKARAIPSDEYDSVIQTMLQKGANNGTK